ncbi:hypothetical protein GGI12_006184 [Dipsacomyces acuminosporus]|nr:hypothetical protein GGI12_006184 [Dipsacomyces acuminosporus]
MPKKKKRKRSKRKPVTNDDTTTAPPANSADASTTENPAAVPAARARPESEREPEREPETVDSILHLLDRVDDGIKDASAHSLTDLVRLQARLASLQQKMCEAMKDKC